MRNDHAYAGERLSPQPCCPSRGVIPGWGASPPSRGFTLVELMVATVISVTMILGVSLFMASLGRQSSRMQTEQNQYLNLGVTLTLLKQSVAQMGSGVPWALLGQSPAQMRWPDMVDWIARYTFTNADNVAVANAWGGSAPNKMPGTDEIWLGGVGMDFTPSSQKVSSAFYSGALAAGYTPVDNFVVPRNDLAGGFWNGFSGYHPAPSFDLTGGGGLGLAGDQVALFDPEQGWLSCGGGGLNLNNQYPFGTLTNPSLCGPILVNTATIPGATPALVLVNLDASSPRRFWTSLSTQGRAYAVTMRNPTGNPGTTIGPLQAVHWYLRNDGTLMVRYLPGPGAVCPGECPETPVLTGVRDFQISYLVWPCQGAAPVWVSNLIYQRTAGGEGGYFANPANRFHNAPAGSLLGMMRRLMTMRARLLALRVSLLMEVPGARPEGYTVPPAITVENHTNTGLNPQRYYYLVQELMDPVNFRLKLGARSYIPIRSATDDAATYNGLFCDALCTGNLCPQ